MMWTKELNKSQGLSIPFLDQFVLFQFREARVLDAVFHECCQVQYVRNVLGIVIVARIQVRGLILSPAELD